MSDMGDMYNEMNKERKKIREKFGVPCASCKVKFPRASHTIMLPGQRCKVCGHVDPRTPVPFCQLRSESLAEKSP